MIYQHRWLDGRPIHLPAGKAVCVGRNYAAHARELGNEVPESPILFIKSRNALVDLERPLMWPADAGACHFETEIALLIGASLHDVTPAAAAAAITGIGLALDLTLRDLQNELKTAGHPWERAKAFDGACPVSRFAPPPRGRDFSALGLRAVVNGEVRQRGNSGQMLFAIPELLAYMSHWFTLEPGDIVLTGTPEGVGPLHSGDELKLELDGVAGFATRVAG